MVEYKEFFLDCVKIYGHRVYVILDDYDYDKIKEYEDELIKLDSSLSNLRDTIDRFISEDMTEFADKCFTEFFDEMYAELTEKE